MEEPKVGVYICQCGVNIASTVDTSAVAQYAAALPHVAISRDYRYMCSDPGQDLIKRDVEELGLNRVVVASCSPRLHEATFRQACNNAGLNPYLFEMVNIREQCSWVSQDKGANTEKAKALVKGAVGRVYYHEALETKEAPYNSDTLVVGAGIAGIQAALEIANSGHKVYLVEKEPSIGGHMIQLDKTFPTLDCSQCILSPKMSQVGHHPFIELSAYSEVEEVSGYVGHFKVKVRKKARHLDVSKCTGCGLCTEKCPYKTDSKFELNLTKRKAAYIPFPQAIPFVATIDPDICIFIKSQGKKCGACAEFCDPGAITVETLLHQTDEITEFEVGSIILATGFQPMDPKSIPQYGYGKYPNVITGLEFERIVSPTGPTGGKIVLKDGSRPSSVAIVHCVGSRDKNYHEYCSRICCMYALKQAHYVKEELPDTDVYQFYIDMRCFGDGYEEFYERISREGVTFIRGKAAQVTNKATREAEKGRLIVVAEDTLLGTMVRVPIDMVILATAVEPQLDAGKVASLFNIGRKATGFFLERHPKLDPIATSTEGVFVVGCSQGPKDIPDTVAQASAGAARVLAMISKGKITLEAAISSIDEEMCSGCRTCLVLCPFRAVSFDEEKKVCRINGALCQGCGICAGACPSDAISAQQSTDNQILSQLAGVLA
jgi:heterodisulfide reductase subunit A2